MQYYNEVSAYMYAFNRGLSLAVGEEQHLKISHSNYFRMDLQ